MSVRQKPADYRDLAERTLAICRQNSRQTRGVKAASGGDTAKLSADWEPPAAQSRTGSLVEAVANVLAGFGIALLIQHLVFPLFGFAASAAEHLGIALLFTAASLVRSYALRRLFEALENARIHEEARRLQSLRQRLATGRP